MVVHNFYEDVAKADDPIYAPMWEYAYRQRFRNFSSRTPAPGKSIGQARGVDVLVYCHHDQVFRLDEKIREEDYNDLLLEYESDNVRHTPGWIEKDLAIDYLSYAILPARTVRLFPFPLLQRAWQVNRDKWFESDRCHIIEAQNPSYTTLSLAVPFGFVYAALSQVSIIDNVPIPEKVYVP